VSSILVGLTIWVLPSPGLLFGVVLISVGAFKVWRRRHPSETASGLEHE